MFTNPTTPNASDYISFLYGAVGIKPISLPTVKGTATGGSTTTLTDTSQAWTVNQWGSPFSYDVLDTTTGQLSGIASNTSNTLTLSTAFNTAVATGDTYIVMPDIVQTTLSVALDIVNPYLACASSQIYVLAVYNLAADRLINYANDDQFVANQSYFEDLRAKLKISSFTPGVVTSSSDESTSVGLLNPEALKMLTLNDLQTLKTSYGRTYMGYAQAYGTLWGLT